MQPLFEIIGHVLGLCSDNNGHITVVDIFNTSIPNLDHTIEYLTHFFGQGFKQTKNNVL